MMPLLPPGTEVRVVLCTVETLVPGDIAVVALPSGQVAHRFLGLDPAGRLRLRGDSLPAEDPPIDAGQLIGKVSGVPIGWVLPEGIPGQDRAKQTALRWGPILGSLWRRSHWLAVRLLTPIARDASVLRWRRRLQPFDIERLGMSDVAMLRMGSAMDGLRMPMLDSGDELWVARSHGRIVGWLHHRPDAFSPGIEHQVRRAFRQLGVESALYAAAGLGPPTTPRAPSDANNAIGRGPF